MTTSWQSDPGQGHWSEGDRFQTSVFFAATPAAGAFAAALAVAGEEGVMEGVLQTEALSRIILQHLLNEVKHLVVVFALRQHVLLMAKEGQL